MENGVKVGGGRCSVVAKNLQPFNLFSPSDTRSTAFRSTGENGMAASGGFPFTSAQRKELDRQAMIYKYMMASVPVPADLLFPTASNPSISLTGGDPHLERCKRTDGKKWRCSRDVVPHHKYCERHLQKSRPRSRKPVELKNNGNNKKSPLFYNPKTVMSTISSSSSLKSERGTALMERGMDAGQQWQHLVDASVGFGDEGSIYSSIASVFHRDYVQQQPLNMFSYANFPASEDVFKCSSGGESNVGAFFNPDLVFSDKQPQNETSRGYIDAWSNDYFNNNENGNFESSAQGNLSACSLDLSMPVAAGNVLDEEMRKNQVDCGVDDSDGHSRLLSPVSWTRFAQGGPLAEALRPGSVAGGGGGSNPASPYDSISTPATNVSSPSGVLHWSLFSQSDISVCNSPTTLAAAPTATLEGFAFQHLN
ncbi:growth-regulating factor 7-like [Olea europaea subsp. europaea]|uniref:Growth-regulating factor n=1 Tax=Olea europaea subsp. europaea TaxID=158383 RepID=A0A8S0TH62_OLEEU|nr:growth-regulating factor 7-like [Olea europaea subsp. europaea]